MDGRRDQGGPIAVIGIACRFPGARDPAEFHDLTVAGLRLFRPVSGQVPGRARHAALLDDWKATQASSGSAEPGSRDPVPIQRLAAETTALALADAGLRSAVGTLGDAAWARREPGRSGSHAGGDLGHAGGDLGHAGGARWHAGVAAGPGADTPGHAAGILGEATQRHGRAGLVIASAAPDVCGLVSEQFGFSTHVRYPETAYLSSLHAVIAAAAALQAGELDLAVAGGAELGVDPAWLDQQARAGTLGSDEMRVYAADPAGLLPGEGCGIVILARAADAQAAGLPVYAEIAGWSTAPVLRPTPTGTALLPAYHRAGVDPADIHLVEGHGTGTAAGDLTELTTLAQLRNEGKTTAALGAVSANIGYSRAATGIASLIKAALAMSTGTIPPGTGCARPHPLIEAGDTRLRLPERPETWPDGTRLAAVNSLGTANPATMDGASAWPGAEGVHLVLRREREAGHRSGRRRRIATGVPEAAADRITGVTGSWPPAPGKHAAPGPLGAGEGTSREATGCASAAGSAAATSGTGTPGASTPGTGTPGTGTSGAGTPDPGTSGAGTSGTSTPGTGTSGASMPGTGTSGTGTPAAAIVPPVTTDQHLADGGARAAIAAASATAPPPPGAGEIPVTDVTTATAAPLLLAPTALLPAAIPASLGDVELHLADADTPAAMPVPPATAIVPAAAADAPACADSDLPGHGAGLVLSADVLAPPGVFVLCGGDVGALADKLDVIAASAPVLSYSELRELARQLAAGAVRRCNEGGAVVRVALAPATPQQLAGQARQAARRLRAGGPAAAAEQGMRALGGMAEPGVRISAGAAGNVVVIFPGLAESTAGHSALLAASLAGLRTLELAGVRPGAAVGYSLGEITGLVWAGCLPAAEAARLVAQRGQILLGCSAGPAAMARIGADARAVRALCAHGHLHIAAYEGPRAQVVAGSIAGIRDMVRRAEAAGLAAEVLGVASAQHSPAMASCTAPLRSVLAGTPFAPPQRRLISTITGRLTSPGDDIADLLARQLSLPVMFGQALTAAAEEGAAGERPEGTGVPGRVQGPAGGKRTDLLVTVGPDDGLAAVAARCCGVPAIALPVTKHGTLGANSVTTAQAVAALFAAGAVTDLAPFLAGPGSTLATGTVPRMRDAEPGAAGPAGPGGTTWAVDQGSEQRTTARSE